MVASVADDGKAFPATDFMSHFLFLKGLRGQRASRSKRSKQASSGHFESRPWQPDHSSPLAMDPAQSLLLSSVLIRERFTSRQRHGLGGRVRKDCDRPTGDTAVAVIRQGAQGGGAVARERGTVHESQRARREFGEAADRRAHVGI